MKLRVWKSLTFFIGLILFIAAFGVILVAGSIFNPPPYRITIALKEIPPYTVITRDMLGVDEQTMHQRVASRLVHETEIEQYLGGMAIETIHAGEPLPHMSHRFLRRTHFILIVGIRLENVLQSKALAHEFPFLVNV